ncbi:unnamed protein product [Rhodiola kirilowii]
MKQEIILEVSMPCDKCRKEAKKIVASCDGIYSNYAFQISSISNLPTS